jgi:hypothetical protein
MRTVTVASILVLTWTVSARVVESKKAAPKTVAPVTHGGIRYEAPHFGSSGGRDQNGGYVQARAADDDRLLWERMVYRIRYDPALERDVQDVFITSLSLSEDGRRLLVDNDKGERYEMDLGSGAVVAVRKTSARTSVPEHPAAK